MSHTFSQLVWLGANTASEPAGVVNNAAQVSFFEARETACKALQQKFPQKNATVIQTVLTTTNVTTSFTEYNLAEFSAIQPATGLKNLFPGLKAINCEQLTGTTISDAINSLKLNDNNNLLIVDIVDINLALLKAMEQQQQLRHFRSIYVQTTNEALYTGAATTIEITEFLQSRDYVLQQTVDSDPDLPWLNFSINPLCIALQQAQQTNSSLNTELTQVKQHLEQVRKESAMLRQTLDQQTAKQKQVAETKYSGDAQIDDFLSDISPFFYDKFITYVDIGAYIGDVIEKIVASKKISVREAHLYEPNPSSFETLKSRLAETKINSLHLNNFALGETEKTSKFITAKAMTRISNDCEEESTTGTFSSEIKTLDSQIRKITERHIHLLKIDVEGYEMEVLKGAEEVLKTGNVDIIYIEVGFNKTGTQQTYMGKIDSFLQDMGYRVFRIYEQRNEWIEDLPLLRRCNFSYMSESFSKSNPYKLTKTIAELRAEIKRLQHQQKTNI